MKFQSAYETFDCLLYIDLGFVPPVDEVDHSQRFVLERLDPFSCLNQGRPSLTPADDNRYDQQFVKLEVFYGSWCCSFISISICPLLLCLRGFLRCRCHLFDRLAPSIWSWTLPTVVPRLYSRWHCCCFCYLPLFRFLWLEQHSICAGSRWYLAKEPSHIKNLTNTLGVLPDGINYHISVTKGKPSSVRISYMVSAQSD